MGATRQHSPVILLLGKRARGQDSIDDWLAASRYTACEAADVFQALEQVSDFTQRDRPDVIFLHVDPAVSDREFLDMLVATASDEPDVPIIDFAESSKCGDHEAFEKAVAVLASQLDQIIPKRNAARA